MISGTTFCSAQASVMHLALTGPMPVTSRSRSGAASIVSNTLFAESLDELLRVDGPDSGDHAGAEIFVDAVERRRRRRLEESGAKLQSVGAVIDPLAAGGNPFSGRDRGRLPDHRHQVALAARLGPKNAEAVLFVVEGDALDEAGQDFLCRNRRIGMHLPPIIGARAARRNTVYVHGGSPDIDYRPWNRRAAHDSKAHRLRCNPASTPIAVVALKHRTQMQRSRGIEPIDTDDRDDDHGEMLFAIDVVSG